MIGTLLAQEIRATRKTLLSTIGILLLVAAVSLVLTGLRVPVLGSIGLYIGMISVILIVPVVLAILAENYWRTMYGREGYFTMTIPVRGRTLYTAKTVYGVIASIVALAITAIGLLGGAFAAAVSMGEEPWSFIRDGIVQIQPWMLWLGVLGMTLQVAFLVVVGASVMTIGAEGRFNHLGFGAPVIGAVVLYLVMQVVTFVGILFIPFGVRLTGPDAGELVAQGMLDGVVAAIADSTSQPEVLGLGFVFTSLAVMAVLAWWGARSVERHTSLR